MYMMGMMMGTMADPLHTHKNKERKRKKNNYVYQVKFRLLKKI